MKLRAPFYTGAIDPARQPEQLPTACRAAQPHVPGAVDRFGGCKGGDMT